MKDILVFGFFIVLQLAKCSVDLTCRPHSHGAILPDQNDCERFYICVWGHGVHFKCPEGLSFNPEIRVCDWPGNVICGQPSTTLSPQINRTTTGLPNINTTVKSPVPTSSNEQDSHQEESEENESHEQGPCGPNEHGSLLSDPRSCESYYQCVHGRSVKKDCPRDLHFNEKLHVCDWPINVGCEGSGDGDSGESTESTEDPAESEEDGSGDSIEEQNCGTIRHGDLTSDPLDCGRYFHCVWGRNILRFCPKGLHFNALLKVCDWPYQAQCKVGVIEENA